MNVMGDVIFDTERGGHVGLIMFWDSFQSCSRPLLVEEYTVRLSESAMWCVCTELHATTTASSIMTSIFAWVVPFTLLNSLTAM